MKKLCILVCGLLLVSGLLWAGGSGEPAAESEDTGRYGGTLTRAYFAPGTLDPAFAVPDMTYSAGNGVFNGLVRLKPGTLDFDKLEGDLAESWEISEDGLVYTFHLRKDVQWHKGYGEFTADDVKYTFDRLKNPDLGAPFAAKFLIIDEVKVIDKYTAQIILKTVEQLQTEP